MQIVRLLLLVLLGATGCTNSDSEPQAAPTIDPIGSLASAESLAEQGGEEASATPSRSGLMPEPTADEPRWVRCSEELVSSVRSFPLQVGGEQTTLGERLDNGAVAEAIERLDNSFIQGTWMCIEGGDTRELEFRASFEGAEFGPRWVLQDAQTLRPINLLAEAVHGTWDAEPGDEDAVRLAVLQCRVGSTWLTSGAYTHLFSAEDSESVAPQWTVLPDVRVGRVATYRAILSWRSSAVRHAADWRVVPSNSTCEPLTPAARRITQITEAIPRHREQLAQGSVRPTNRPATNRSERGRALGYTFAEERELLTIVDYLKFRERQLSFELGEWEVSGGNDASGAREVSLLVRGDAPFSVTYRVNTESGATTPHSTAAALARAILPLRAPGVGELGSLPIRLEQDVIDAHVSPVLAQVGACIPRGSSRLTIHWWIAWDGHTYDIDSEPNDREVAACAREVVSQLQFPQFIGSPLQTSSVVSVGQ